MPIAAAALAFLVNAMRIMLMAKIGAIIVKLLLFFGISIVVNKYAIDPLLDALASYVQAGAGTSLGSVVMQWAGVLKLDQAVTMVIGAYSTAATIKGTKVALGITGD